MLHDRNNNGDNRVYDDRMEMDTHLHTHSHTHTHTDSLTHTHSNTHTNKPSHTHLFTLSHTLFHKHTHTYSPSQTHTDERALTCIRHLLSAELCALKTSYLLATMYKDISMGLSRFASLS